MIPMIIFQFQSFQRHCERNKCRCSVSNTVFRLWLRATVGHSDLHMYCHMQNVFIANSQYANFTFNNMHSYYLMMVDWLKKFHLELDILDCMLILPLNYQNNSKREKL